MEFLLCLQTDDSSAAEPADQEIYQFLKGARFLYSATDGVDTELVVAGLLHHVLESAWTTHIELANSLSVWISDLVAEITRVNRTGGPRPTLRRYGNVNHYSARAKLLVVADPTSNLICIAGGSHNGLDAGFSVSVR